MIKAKENLQDMTILSVPYRGMKLIIAVEDKVLTEKLLLLGEGEQVEGQPVKEAIIQARKLLSLNGDNIEHLLEPQTTLELKIAVYDPKEKSSYHGISQWCQDHLIAEYTHPELGCEIYNAKTLKDSLYEDGTEIPVGVFILSNDTLITAHTHFMFMP